MAVPVLDFPSVTPRAFMFKLLPRTRSFQGPLATVERTETLGVPLWRGRLIFPPRDPDEMRPLKTFLRRLDSGPGGRFYMGDSLYLRDGPRGTASGAPKVDGGGQSGDTLLAKDFGLNETVLREGDYVAWNLAGNNRELHYVIADAQSDGTGLATINVKPPIRNAPANNELLIIAGATCVMRLLNEETAQAEHDVEGFAELVLEIVESPLPLV